MVLRRTDGAGDAWRATHGCMRALIAVVSRTMIMLAVCIARIRRTPHCEPRGIGYNFAAAPVLFAIPCSARNLKSLSMARAAASGPNPWPSPS